MSIRRSLLPAAGIAWLLALFSTSGLAWGAPPTADQRTQVRSAEAALKKAANLYRSKKFAEAGEAVKDAQEILERLGDEASREVRALVAPVHKQLAKARQLLTVEGIELPPVKTPTKSGRADGVSFTRQVAPLLVAKCGACHVQRARGELSMATYTALAKGSKNGPVISAGDAQGSRIVEVIATGEMPKGGGKVSADELTLLSMWIAGGAKFDGADSAAPLTSFAPTDDKTKDSASPRLAVVAATGREEVQFARDVAPLLVAHCIECHGDRNPRNNFSVGKFNGLLRGGDEGPALAPGKSDESLLIQKLRGTSDPRMPFNRDPLPGDAIAKIAKWIDLGAKFDGPDPASPLEEVIALTAARRSTHDELTKTRAQLAAKNWRLILPDAPANHEETANVLVYGGVSPEVLADVGRVADQEAGRLRKFFKLPSDEPLIKGRLTLFVFDKRYDYGEVGTMLEDREIPSTWRGHWRYTGVDAYGCLLLSGDHVSPGVVAQVMAGAYVASLGKIPRWFSEGTARALAARVDAKDPRVKLWDEQVPRIAGASEKPDGFLTSALPPEDNDILSYSFAKYLMTTSGKYAALVAALQQGAAFDTAFTKNFAATPAQVTAQWSAKAVKRKG